MPQVYLPCRFENFDSPPALRKKIEALQTLAQGKLKRGMYLFGSIGAGKTHVAVSALAEQLMRGAEGRFVRSIHFASRCRTAFRPENDTSVDAIVADLLSSDVLIFDDLGCDKSSEFLRESLLNLFDTAYCEQRTVIVTSNLSIPQVNEIEPRIASRITQMCVPFEIGGLDYRIRKGNEAVREASNARELTESVATVRER